MPWASTWIQAPSSWLPRRLTFPGAPCAAGAKEGDWETLLARVQAEVEARLAQASIQRQTDVRALALDIQLLSLQKLHTQMSAGEIVKGFAAVAESMGRILNATPAGDDSKGETFEDALLRVAGEPDGE